VTDPEFERIQSISRDNAASILRQLEKPNLEAMIALLESLPADTPCPTIEAWRRVTVPTLVLVNGMDAHRVRQTSCRRDPRSEARRNHP
jgi:hypothetical protein